MQQSLFDDNMCVCVCVCLSNNDIKLHITGQNILQTKVRLT